MTTFSFLRSICLCGIILGASSVHADDDIDKSFDHLWEQGRQAARNNDYLAVIEAYRKAAGLKNSAAAWIRIVINYGVLAQGKPNDPVAYCDESRNALKQFFRACDKCADFEDSRTCRPCKYIELKTSHLANRTLDYADQTKTRIESQENVPSRRLTRQREKLKVLETALRRCLGLVRIKESEQVDSLQLRERYKKNHPAQDYALGTLPLKVLLFHGPNTLLISSPDGMVKEYIVEAIGGETIEIPIELQPKTTEKKEAVPLTTESLAPPPPPADPLMGWISVGVGTVALATSGVFVASAISKRDEADSINGQFGRRGEFNDLKERSRTALTVSGITGGLGLITTAAGVWMLVREPNAPKKASFNLIPGGLSLNGTF